VSGCAGEGAERTGSVAGSAVVAVEIREVKYDEPGVRELVALALGDLSARYGGSGDDTPVTTAEFAPPLGRFFVAVEDGRMIGCAGWRTHSDDAELKRMFTLPAARGRGVARQLLATVEASARADGRRRVILEMGDRQPEAVSLYRSAGYRRIDDFGYYKDYRGVLSFARDL
jgi:GNAT superfamily N-acetyltransferase